MSLHLGKPDKNCCSKIRNSLCSPPDWLEKQARYDLFESCVAWLVERYQQARCDMFEVKPGSMAMVERQARYELMEVMSAWVWLKDTNRLEMNCLKLVGWTADRFCDKVKCYIT